MSHLSGTQTGYNNQSWYDNRNRESRDQWCTMGSIRCRGFTPGNKWSASRFAGSSGWSDGNINRSDASDWDVDFQEAGNSSHKRITGVARDGEANGAIFPSGAIIKAYLTATDVVQGTCTADTGGFFDCPTRAAGAHYIGAYYDSIPPKAGFTAKTLTPT